MLTLKSRIVSFLLQKTAYLPYAKTNCIEQKMKSSGVWLFVKKFAIPL